MIMASGLTVSSCFICVLAEVKSSRIASTHFLHHLLFKVVF